MSWIFSSWQLTSCIGWFHLAVIGSSRPRPPAPIFLAHNASIMRCWLVNNIVSSAARPSSPHSSISIILYYLYLHTDRCVCKRFFTMFVRGHTRRRCLQAPAPTIQSTFFILTLLATISEYCTLHSEHRQTSLTCLRSNQSSYAIPCDQPGKLKQVNWVKPIPQFYLFLVSKVVLIIYFKVFHSILLFIFSLKSGAYNILYILRYSMFFAPQEGPSIFSTLYGGISTIFWNP